MATILSLAPEIRNKIYQCVLVPTRVLICIDRNNNQKTDTLRLQHRLDNNDIWRGSKVSLSLLLSCRQLSDEVQYFLYSQTTFCFDDIETIQTFLDRIPIAALGMIQTMELVYHCPSPMRWMKKTSYYRQYESDWKSICVQLGLRLTGLKTLVAIVHFTHWPLKFSTGRRETVWKSALDDIAHRSLQSVQIRMSVAEHLRVKPRVLIDLSRSIEDDLMTKQAQDERDKKESKLVLQQLARERISPVLVIRDCKPKNVAPKPAFTHYTSRLSGYSRLDPTEIPVFEF